ncbi:MAG: adenine deaminase, partial [Eubacteriaceae bacterium]
PGFIDGHIHIESSMLTPTAFADAVLPHGTTAVVTDPHEIANVAGSDGIRYMLAQTLGSDLDVFFMLPSCVPATSLDESGSVLEAQELRPFIRIPRVLGLAELMDFYGTVRGDKNIIDKIAVADEENKLIDGHAPFLSGNDLNAYITAGVRTDHECSTAEEAIEKLKKGQWLMIREGTAAQNLEALMPLFKYPYCERILLVTDDKHPGDLIRKGHINYIIRKAVSLGAAPEDAIIAATRNAAECFGMRDRGAVSPGYKADLVVVDDLADLNIRQVYTDGKLVAENGRMIENEKPVPVTGGKYKSIFQSFNMDPVTESDLSVPSEGPMMRVVQVLPNELITEERIEPWTEHEGYAPGVDIEKDIIKAAVFERHRRSGHTGVGFLGGYGLKKGAVATSIAHDSHNLIAAGTNDADIILAANTVRDNHGGLAAVVDGKVIGELPLPIGGLMTDAPAADVDARLEDMKARLRELGIPEDIDPFMTLGFASLPVIPKLRLNTLGLIDTDRQAVLPVRFNPDNPVSPDDPENPDNSVSTQNTEA